MKTSGTLLQRLLRRLLASGRGEVRAMEDAIHLEGVLRFIAVFFLTVGLPAVLLAYFGVSSIAAEERSVTSEVQRDARALADTFWSQTDRRFSGFEERVLTRLEAGRSPLESARELHPSLLTALRFDEAGRLTAPFVEEEASVRASGVGVPDPAWWRVWQAESRGEADPGTLRDRYLDAAALASSRDFEGRARFDAARMLASEGDLSGAEDELLTVEARYSGARDPWGFRLSDLARLEQARLQLARDAGAGEVALRALVEAILRRPWVVGQGGASAVASRSLSLAEPLGTREWVDAARGRIDERAEMLYWTGVLLPEFRRLSSESREMRMGPGALRWRLGERGIWATTWWEGELYAFALDRETVLAELKADARGLTVPEAPVSAWLADPLRPVVQGALTQRSLAPWLTGWHFVVEHRNPDQLATLQRQRRSQRIGVVGLAVLLLSIGAVLSARFVKRELDIARMQTSFAANVSHELRSPITQIRLKGESLLLGLTDTEEEQEAAFHAIVRESERLSRLVDNVLDFAAIERGKKQYVLRPGDLAGAVMRSIDSVADAVELQDKDLDVDLPWDLPEVAFDADAVAQCVINLVSNAAKYSDPGGWIRVRGRVVDGFVEIAISDQGIGIPPHDLRQIFEPFYRSSDSLARRRQGTGSGRTITRDSMRAHGGEGAVSSRPGEGSTFRLRFPLPAAPPAPQGSGERDTAPTPH